jgi:hypothetical protein
MIIVSGRIHVRPGARPGFLTASLDAVTQARGAAGCRDFVVAADGQAPRGAQVTTFWGRPSRNAMTLSTTPWLRRSMPSGVWSALCGVSTTCSQASRG